MEAKDQLTALMEHYEERRKLFNPEAPRLPHPLRIRAQPPFDIVVPSLVTLRTLIEGGYLKWVDCFEYEITKPLEIPK